MFKRPQPKRPKSLRIYESHVGMSSPVRSFFFLCKSISNLFPFPICIVLF